MIEEPSCLSRHQPCTKYEDDSAAGKALPVLVFIPLKALAVSKGLFARMRQPGADASFLAIFEGVLGFSVSSESGPIFVHPSTHPYPFLTVPEPQKRRSAHPSAPQRRFRLLCKNPAEVKTS
jgi:hypothetical protein